jgi:hypothetical protein
MRRASTFRHAAIVPSGWTRPMPPDRPNRQIRAADYRNAGKTRQGGKCASGSGLNILPLAGQSLRRQRPV